jgi:pimeloyl-ACP methyl ester carboxylesterase
MMDIELQGTHVGERAWAYTGGRAFDPTLPCIAFVHGALHDHSVWTLLARWFAHHGWSVLAFDQPGHARSQGPVRDSVEALADWLLAALAAAGVQRAALVGHSMGSLIALEAAARAPQCITHLALLGTAAPMKVSQALLDGARTQVAATLDRVNDFSHAGLAAKPGFPGPGNWLHGGNLALMARVMASQRGCNLFEHDFRLCNDYANALSAAAQVRCPAHILIGQHDQMTPPRASAELARALKASVHALPCGHALMTEDPEGVLRILRQALG